jgi:S1-C subfamily serine protease
MAKAQLLAIFLVPVIARAALIPPFFVESVVALGRSQIAEPGQPQWITEASGFLYGVSADKETDQQKHTYEVYLVTNRHVLSNHSQITIRLNAEKTTDPVRELPIDLKDAKGAAVWFSHPNPNVDVSVIHLNARFLREQHLQSSFFRDDLAVADKAKMSDIGLSIGDAVFVLGFPMGIYGTGAAQLCDRQERNNSPNQ